MSHFRVFCLESDPRRKMNHRPKSHNSQPKCTIGVLKNPSANRCIVTT